MLRFQDTLKLFTMQQQVVPMRIVLLVITFIIPFSAIFGAVFSVIQLENFGLIASPLALISALGYFYLENQRQGVNGQGKRT